MQLGKVGWGSLGMQIVHLIGPRGLLLGNGGQGARVAWTSDALEDMYHWRESVISEGSVVHQGRLVAWIIVTPCETESRCHWFEFFSVHPSSVLPRKSFPPFCHAAAFLACHVPSSTNAEILFSPFPSKFSCLRSPSGRANSLLRTEGQLRC